MGAKPPGTVRGKRPDFLAALVANVRARCDYAPKPRSTEGTVEEVADAVDESLRRIHRACCEEAARLADIAPDTALALMRAADRLCDDDHRA